MHMANCNHRERMLYGYICTPWGIDRWGEEMLETAETAKYNAVYCPCDEPMSKLQAAALKEVQILQHQMCLLLIAFFVPISRFQ